MVSGGEQMLNGRLLVCMAACCISLPLNGQPMSQQMKRPDLAGEVGDEFLPPPRIPNAPPALIESEQSNGPEYSALTLTALEAMVREHNPTLQQASAQIEGNFGKAIEAGLWPNPTVGYIQDNIGVEGTAGEFAGGFVQQEIPNAHKRKLSRAKYLERTRTAEWLAVAQGYRAINDIRIHFYRTFGHQEIVALHQELLKNAENNNVTFRELYNVGQATRPEVHQANIMLQERRLQMLTAINDYRQQWEELTAITGLDIPPTRLDGSLDSVEAILDWEKSLAYVLEGSPEIKAAEAKLRADQITLKREKVEKVPNIFVRGQAGHNYETSEPVAGAQIFFELPIHDWNQGTVRQAAADLVRQQAEIRRVQLDLRRRLSMQYRNYLTAMQHVQSYRDVLLPEAKAAYEELLDSYEKDRVRWTLVLDAQQRFTLLRIQYLRSLIGYRESETLIAGFLLHGGLDAPPNPTPPGHIDSVARPR